MLSTTRALLVAGAVTVLALAGCSSSPDESDTSGFEARPRTAADDAMDAYYEAAVESGRTTVTLYSAAAKELEPVFEPLEARYPEINIEPVRLVGANLVSRVQAEMSSGSQTADVIIGAMTASSMDPAYRHWYEPFRPVRAEELPDFATDSEGIWFAPFTGVSGISYNSANVDADEVPHSWDDLLDERWRGRLSIGDPSVSSHTSVTMVSLLNNGTIDDEWMEKFAQQDLTIFGETPQVAQSLTTGETDAAIFGLTWTNQQKKLGAPVEFVSDTAVTSPYAASLLKGAPNPDAAKLFLTYLLTDEAQTQFAELGELGLVEGSPFPDGLSPDMDIQSPPSYLEGNELLRQTTARWKELLNK